MKKPKATERVLCFAEQTGVLLWTYTYPVTYPEWAFVPGQGGGPTSTPIVEAGRIYSMGGNGHLHCLDTRDGSVIWERDFGKEYEIRELMCRASPLIDGELLIVCPGGKPGATVMAVDKKTGRDVWKSLDEAVANSSPIVITAGGQRQLIVWTGESVTSLNPATGEKFWREALTTSNNDANATPIFEKNRLLIGGMMFALDPDRPAATILWPQTKVVTKRIFSNTSTALILGDHLYTARSSGQFICVDPTTGQQVWQAADITDQKNGASIHLTTIGDSVFLFTNQGDLLRTRLTPEGCQILSRGHLVDPTTPFAGRNCAWAPASFANGRVFVRSDAEIVCASLAAQP